MQLFKHWPTRILTFILILVILAGIADLLLVPIFSRQFLISYDFQNSPDMDIVSIGNSLCINHIDPHNLEKVTGMSSINHGAVSARIDSYVAVAREVFSLKSPEVLIVVFDPTIQASLNEDTAVMAWLSPMLKSPWNRLRYLLDELKYDSQDINRAFLWKTSMETDLSQIKKNIQIRCGINVEEVYKQALQQYNNKSREYVERGLFIMYPTKAYDSLRVDCRIRREIKDESFPPELYRGMKKIQDLCEKNDCQMIMVTTPITRDIALSDGRYITAMRSAEEFCQAENIPYFNFTYAQGKSMPDFSEYYYSSCHLNREGTGIFNDVFANVMNEYIHGRDVSDYFYTEEDWRASIDRITDLWFVRKESKGKQTYTAYTTHGTPVKPEYQFVTIDEDGRESILQDYSSTNTFSIASADIQGKIKVYARNASDDSQKPMAYTE